MTTPMEQIDAEQVVLGVMMNHPRQIPDIEAILTGPDVFYRAIHGTIYATILRLRDAEQPTDPAAVVAALIGTGDISKVGGVSYIHDLAAKPAIGTGGYYARIVLDAAARRSAAEFGARVQHMATSGGTLTAAELIDRVQHEASQLRAGPPTGGTNTWAQIAPAVLAAIEQAGSGEMVGLPTGLPDLDQLLGGLRGGQLIVVAGRPSMGKSVLVTQILQHTSWKLDHPALLFSLEMTQEELGQRMLAAATKTNLGKIKAGNLDDEDWAKLAKTIGASEKAPLRIDDTPHLTVPEIRTIARQHHRAGQLDILAVDHLGLLTPPGRAESRQVAVSEMSRGLKLLAKELNIPVIVAAQLNRGPEARTDKRPQLSDLRDSGAIEQDADVVILLHRDDYYDPESPRAGEADLIVAKNRNGPTDTVTVAAQLHFSRLVSLAA